MGFLKQIADFFFFLFYSTSPQAEQKRALKKIENALRDIHPPLYKDGELLPSFIQAVHLLYQQTRMIQRLLASTLYHENSVVATHYVDVLISTGFSDDGQSALLQLTYEQRKQNLASAGNPVKELERQKLLLDKLIKECSNQQFRKIELVLQKLAQLWDLCNFNYFSVIRVFDKEFTSDNSGYEPVFQPVKILGLENHLLELYYILDDFTITNSVAKALTVLYEQNNAGRASKESLESFSSEIRKTASVLTRYLNADNLKMFLCLIKNDANFQPPTGNYSKRLIDSYIARLKTSYESNEQHIRMELQDEQIASDIAALFGDRPLAPVKGYNSENNNFLHDKTPLFFLWTTPLLILKTFVHYYFTRAHRDLLNTIVVEGFFSNAENKTAFATDVFHCSEIEKRITDFENSFSRGAENEWDGIKRLVLDGQMSPELNKQLIGKIGSLNTEVKAMLESDLSHFSHLVGRVNELMKDSKKVKPEYVTNIKVLFASIRNKENTEILEKQYPQWVTFIEIMKNYITIPLTEKL